jgi:hypothetical protein
MYLADGTITTNSALAMKVTYLITVNKALTKLSIIAANAVVVNSTNTPATTITFLKPALWVSGTPPMTGNFKI